MNLWELIFKQMRQRLLSTVLAILSVALGMAMATGIDIVGSEGKKVFTQTDYGYDLIVGPKGDTTSLVLNTVYHIGKSPGMIPYHVYEDLSAGEFRADGSPGLFRGMIDWAVPYAVGDSYHGRPIVGTSPRLFGVDDSGKPLTEDKRIPRYREGGPDGGRYTFAAGKPFAPDRFEAVIGSEVAAALKLGVGKSFQATHGFPRADEEPDVHPETWTIVGVLNETHTASDRTLFIPLMSFYAISEHEETLGAIAHLQGTTTQTTAPDSKPAEPKPYVLNPDGTFALTLPRDEWQVSAVLIHSSSATEMMQLPFRLSHLSESVGGGAMAVTPAKEMQDLFNVWLPGISRILLLIAALVTIISGVSILVSIYNSVTARNREIAIMRALGATRARILAAVCLEAVLIGLIGGILGLLGGHLMAFGGSIILERTIGTGIAWWHISPLEFLFLPAVIAVSFLAGLVPATKAFSITVAEHLA